MHERIRRAKDEGFTLIELLIVVIILGILAAIVVFAVGSTRKDSLNATCKTDVKSIQLAEEAYNTKQGKYTTATGDLTTTSTGGGVLKTWPTNPNLTFALSGDTAAYTIGITGDITGSVPSDATDATINTQCGG